MSESKKTLYELYFEIDKQQKEYEEIVSKQINEKGKENNTQNEKR